tara:strand:- start:272 stop:1195 length:924 start_codon:yes stop_codon:yes gene_type:complete
MKAHVSEIKKEEVKELKDIISKYKVVGIINLSELPSPQLQTMRKKIPDSKLKVTKKRLLRIAIEELKDKIKGIEKLNEKLTDKALMPCLILVNNGSFKLASTLKKSKSKIAAKPGQIAPDDINVSAGPTPFTPGPIIGELGALGIKATVEEGKIVIKEDCLLVKKGDEIDAKQADMLMKLGVEPIEIGLNLVATFEDGTVFEKETLEIDENHYLNLIKQNASESFKLAISIGYLTKETITHSLQKAESEAKALSESLELPGSDAFSNKLATAEKQAESLKSNVKETSEEVKEEQKEEVENKDPKEEK